MTHLNNRNSNTDAYYMTLAIAEAKKSIYLTRPNPAVGCILIKDDVVIGQGCTSPVGGHHAEINAMANAHEQGYDVAGATAYVTLEPCSHYGRTPPCALALVKAGIDTVVIAGLDPNPKVAGQGIKILKDANVNVVTSVLTEPAEQLNKGFLTAMRTGMPYVRLKVATSLDGKTAMASGESKWITGGTARDDVQQLRAISGAIITGSQTVIDDNPKLTVRSTKLGVMPENIPQPKPVILDRRCRLSNQSDYTLCKRADTLFWRQQELPQLLSTLVNEHQCYDIMVEAGASVTGSFIQAGLVDELIVYQAPCLLGSNARNMAEFSIGQLNQQHRWQLVSHETLGDDLKLVFHRL